MKTYCLGCKNTQIIFIQKKVIMMNKVIRDKSICANSMADKSKCNEKTKV